MSFTLRYDEKLHLGLLVIKPWKQQSNNTVTDSLRLPEGIEVLASRRNQRKLKSNCANAHSHRIDPVESERRISFPIMIPREDSKSDIRTTK
jgi:hypothetical protein